MLLSSRWSFAVVIALACLVFVPTLTDWFTGDDFAFLYADQTHSLGQYARESVDFRNIGSSPEFDRYRPLYPLLWKLEYDLFGLRAVFYHAIVVALHLGSIALVWRIARHLFEERWAANLAALVFGLQPAYSDAVAWIGSNRVFEGFPYLLSFFLFILYAERTPGDRHRVSSLALLSASVLAFIAAILIHSSALSLVAVLPAYQFFVLDRPGSALGARAWLPLTPYIAVGATLFGIQLWVRSRLPAGDAFSLSWGQYTVYARYLGLAAFPVASDTGPAILRRIVDALQGVGAATLLLALLFLVHTRPVDRRALFAAAWFFVALLPDSTFVIPSSRALYVPGAALSIFIVALVIRLGSVVPHRVLRSYSAALPVLLILVAIGVTALSYQRTLATRHDAARNERLVDQLRDVVPELGPGGVLYVVNPPRNLVNFGSESRLQAAVQLHFPDVVVHAVPAQSEGQVESSKKPEDVVFTFK